MRSIGLRSIGLRNSGLRNKGLRNIDRCNPGSRRTALRARLCRFFLQLFPRARWFLSLNRRRGQHPGHCNRHANKSNRFQISPHIFYLPAPVFTCSGLICRAFQTFPSATTIGLSPWAFGCTAAQKTGKWESVWGGLLRCFLLGFLLLLLQVAGLFLLQIGVNVGPKLF